MSSQEFVSFISLFCISVGKEESLFADQIVTCFPKSHQVVPDIIALSDVIWMCPSFISVLRGGDR